MTSSKARISLAFGALGAAVLAGGGAAMLHGQASTAAPQIVSFVRDGERCFTIPGEPGVGGGGRGGSATVCGEGSQVQPGAGGGSIRIPPTYTVRNGQLMRVLAGGGTEPVAMP